MKFLQQTISFVKSHFSLILIVFALILGFAHFAITILGFNRCVVNSGVALGLLNQLDMGFLVIGVVLVFVLLIYAVKRLNPNRVIVNTVFAMFVAGVSNLVDRVRFGGVCDYFVVPGITVFNLNDFVITICVIIILYESIWKTNNNRK